MTPTPGWLTDQLPRAMAEDHFTRRFVGIFEEVASGYRGRIANVEHALSTQTGTRATVRWLGSWLGLDIPTQLDLERTREIVDAGGRQIPIRGTVTGLKMLLEAACPGGVIVEESGGVYRAGEAPASQAEVTVRVDDPGLFGADGVLRLVSREVPADVAVSVRVGSELVVGAEPEATVPAEPDDGPTEVVPSTPEDQPTGDMVDDEGSRSDDDGGEASEPTADPD